MTAPDDKTPDNGTTAHAAAKDAAEASADTARATQGQGDATTEQDGTKKEKKSWRSLLLGGDILKRRAVLRQLPLLLLIMFYFILMVSNRYTVERLTKEKIATTERIDQMREQRIQRKRQYQESIKISTIAAQLDSVGIGLTAEPPYRIEK